ncbi:rRNA maturation RNase YbeY [Brevibacterium litoralis]|uniref:rRNA maturation RNase YbeY n=1 Tax=Brevibacterium litoralis TaxID=3138935 RepID=UPI0032EADEDC
MSAEITNETEHAVDLQQVEDLVAHVVAAMHLHPGVEVYVRFIPDEAMEDLHVQWMDLEGTTDVMSFPMDELTPGDESTEGILGDIVISPVVAAEQARAAGHSTMDEILLLTTHGLLHLMGYDHEEPEEKTEMFGLQRHLLLTWFAEREPGRTDLPAPTED